MAENARAHRVRLREWMNEMKKDLPCVDCGRKDIPVTEKQWDHLPGTTKVMKVTNMVAKSYGKEKILAEIAKCELVCERCHALRGHKRGQLKAWGHQK